jgi:hypothetical protein
MVDLFEPVTALLADVDRLAAEPRLEMADRFVLRDLRRYGTVPLACFSLAPPFAGGILA